MKPFHKILVPIDFSSYSAEAIRVAADLSRRYEGKLALVHVYEPVTPSVPDGFLFYMPGQLEKLLAEYGKLLAAAKRDAEIAGAVHVDTHQLQGHISSKIVELASDGEFDLIVMGTHGRTGLKHVMLGSVAEQVVRRAPCAVLTVRGQSR